MKQFIKRIFILLVILTFILAFSYSYNALGISNISLFVAIGVDLSDDDNLVVTFQFTDISPVSQSGSTETKTPTTFSITAPSIHSAIGLMTTYTGKDLSLSHCKLIVFSEEIAYRGISNEISTLVNDSQIRPSTNIVISKSTAKDYLKNSTPHFDNLITKHYETFVDSSKYTGYSADITISDFFSSLLSPTKEPVAILGKVSNTSTPFNSQISDYNGTENTGLAVFKEATLVGELTESQTLAYLATIDKLQGFLITIPDPYDSQNFVDVYISPKKQTSTQVEFINSTPYISLDYTFSGRIYSASSNYDYLDNSILETVSSSCNSYLNNIFSEFLYKTSKDFNSDICNLGQYSKSQFKTLTDFNNYNWANNYQNSFFNINVNTTVKSGFLLSEN